MFEKIFLFAVKLIMIYLLSYLFLFYTFSKFNSALKHQDRIKFIALIENPAAFEMLSENAEHENIEKSIIYMRLAIGLLELHNSNAQVIEKYNLRLALLMKKKQESSKNDSPIFLSPTGKPVLLFKQ